MTSVYDILEVIRGALLESPAINTVSFGDLDKIDLNKTTIFPLGHIMIDNGVVSSNVITFNVKVLVADVVDYNKKDDSSDAFYGNTNEQDVLNTQFGVLNKLITDMIRGDLFSNLYKVEATTTLEPFMDRFDNVLAGWSTTIAIQVPNRISVC